MIKQLFNMPFLKFKKIEYSDTIIKIYVSVKSRRSKCPDCGRYSKSVHDHYFRTISDLPVFHHRTIVFLKTRKFKCLNARCRKIVFSEQTQAVTRYSRRTNRALNVLETYAIELTFNKG